MCAYICVCVCLFSCAFKICAPHMDLIRERWSPYSPNKPSLHPLAPEPPIFTPILGVSSDMGASFAVGFDRNRYLPLSEPAWSLGLSSQNWVPDSSSIQSGPTRLCPSTRFLNWASITNIFAVLTVEIKRARSWNWPVRTVLRPRGLEGGWDGRGRGGKG